MWHECLSASRSERKEGNILHLEDCFYKVYYAVNDLFFHMLAERTDPFSFTGSKVTQSSKGHIHFDIMKAECVEKYTR